MTPGWTTATRFSLVDLEDPVHRGEGDRQTALDAGRAAGQAGPGAARDDRDAELAGRSAPARRPRPCSSGSTTARGRPGMEVGRLVEAVGLAVGRRRSAAGDRAAGRRSPRRAGRPGRACRRSRRAASMPWDRGSSRPKSTRPPEPASERGCLRGRIDRMVRRLPLLLAAVVAVTALALPSPDRRYRARRRRRHRAGVRRTDRARCSTRPTTSYLWLGWGSRKVYVDSLATIRNTSGGADRPGRAQHDRRATRRDPARAGDGRRPRRRGHASATRRSWCRSAACCRPAARRTVRVRYHATLRSSLTGSNWLFTKANGIVDLYRWLPWVSRRIAVRPARTTATRS